VISEVLSNPQPGDHAAHLYSDGESLCEVIAGFVYPGLRQGKAAIVLATREHLEGVERRLRHAALPIDALQRRGQLRLIDAHAVLERLQPNGRLSRAAFDRIIAPTVAEASDRFAGLVAYGEIVDLLWQRGDLDSAERLEQWWGGLLAERGFALLCGYRADAFDGSACRVLECACGTHTHVLPAVDEARFERAVNVAFAEVFPNGNVQALRRSLARRCRLPARMPRAQAALLGLRELMPSMAELVRARARNIYACGERSLSAA